MPYISAPYRPKVKTRVEEWRSQTFAMPPVDTKGRQIDLAPWPDHIDEHGIVHFSDTGRPEAERMKKVTRRPDIVIFATGYKQVFSFLDETYPRPEQADMRRVWKSADESVGFIGFVRPHFGMGRTPCPSLPTSYMMNCNAIPRSTRTPLTESR